MPEDPHRVAQTFATRLQHGRHPLDEFTARSKQRFHSAARPVEHTRKNDRLTRAKRDQRLVDNAERLIEPEQYILGRSRHRASRPRVNFMRFDVEKRRRFIA